MLIKSNLSLAIAMIKPGTTPKKPAGGLKTLIFAYSTSKELTEAVAKYTYVKLLKRPIFITVVSQKYYLFPM